MALRTFQKWHGAGNDFLVEVSEQSTTSWWTPERVRALCDRTKGVGADGLLIAQLSTPVAMTLFNADGSLAEMSGNGIRCLAAAVRRSTGATWSSLDVATSAGPRTVSLVMDGDEGYGSVAMGRVSVAAPLDGTLGVANVGNPHVVVEDRDDWSDADREAAAEGWAQQMGGANVEFVSVLDARRVRLRVIERGVGWTQACGTGSCASVAVLRSLGRVGSDVDVENPGGTLRVRLDGDEATLSGPVAFVANVEWRAI